MKQKPIKPEYQAWRKRIEGQLKHAMNEHPEWFNLPTQEIRDRACRSIAKRVIGEIVVGINSGNKSVNGATTSAADRKSLFRATLGAIGRAASGTFTASRPKLNN